jgi:hypothetical protein
MAAIAEIPDQFLLLRIHRDYGLIPFLEGAYLGVNVLELCVPIRVIPAFLSLAITLQTVSRRFEQSPHSARADGMSLSCQFVRQLRGALASPTQRRRSCQFCAQGGAGRDFLKSASALRVSGDGNAGGAPSWGWCTRRLAPFAPTVSVEPPPRLPILNRVAVYPLGPGRI